MYVATIKIKVGKDEYILPGEPVAGLISKLELAEFKKLGYVSEEKALAAEQKREGARRGKGAPKVEAGNQTQAEEDSGEAELLPPDVNPQLVGGE